MLPSPTNEVHRFLETNPFVLHIRLPKILGSSLQTFYLVLNALLSLDKSSKRKFKRTNDRMDSLVCTNMFRFRCLQTRPCARTKIKNTVQGPPKLSYIWLRKTSISGPPFMRHLSGITFTAPITISWPSSLGIPSNTVSLNFDFVRRI